MFGFEEVFQNRDLSLLFLRPPRHRVTCDLIPLAVLKLHDAQDPHGYSIVTCDLIPLAVLKPQNMRRPECWCLMVTCDLIPLAVLKQRARKPIPPDAYSHM